MILHWLAGCSWGDLMQIAAGGLICLGSGITLLYEREGKDRLPLLVTLVGFLWGACFMVSPVLHAKPQWVGLSHVLTLAGSVFAGIWCVLVNRHSRKRRAAMPPPQLAASSDDVWPPPPTALGGGQP